MAAPWSSRTRRSPPFARSASKVNITELDVDVLPRGDSQSDGGRQPCAAARGERKIRLPAVLPGSLQRALAKRYADLFAVFLKHRDVIGRVTFGAWRMLQIRG